MALMSINTIDESKIASRSSEPGRAGRDLYDALRIDMRIKDEQDAIESIAWDLLPPGMQCDMVERILYYRGSGAWFPIGDQWLFFPCTGKDIDAWGRWQWLTPIPFTGTSSIDDKKIKPFFDNRWFRAVYEVPDPEDLNPEYLENVAVPMYDYSRQYSQTIIPRSTLSEPLLKVISECIPFARTALINGAGIQGFKIMDESQTSEVYRASSAAYRAALNGEKWLPVVGDIQSAAIPTNNPLNVQDYLLAAQSFDNLRLSLHGLSNGGIFEKKQKMLDSEVSQTENRATRTLQNRVKLRQEACTILNSIAGVIAWCEAAEEATGHDRNGDGVLMDDMSNNDVGTDEPTGGEEDAGIDG